MSAGGVELRVRVRPRASREEIVGMHDGRLVIRVTAPPAEGKANEAVRRLIAKRLGVPSSRVRIVRGSRGRDKTLSIEDMDPRALARELASVGLGAKRQDR